ncbi:Gamma-tubulin complex component [Entamoeba marina]
MEIDNLDSNSNSCISKIISEQNDHSNSIQNNQKDDISNISPVVDPNFVAQDITETQVLQDMVFMLNGIEPKYLNYSHHFPPLTTVITPHIKNISNQYKKLNQICSNLTTIGVVQTSVLSTCNDIIREYSNYVAQIDSKIRSGQLVTILEMYKHSLRCGEVLTGLMEVITTCSKLRGGEILTYLEKSTYSPTRSIKTITERFLIDASQPILLKVYDWMTFGKFEDTYHDFFLTIRNSPCLLETTQLEKQLIPSFLNDVVDAIKFVGEAMIFLQQEGQDIEDMLQVIEKNKHVFCYGSNELKSVIHDLNSLAHQKAIILLSTKYTPLIHLDNIRLFILLFRGDFANTLIDSISNALTIGEVNQALMHSHFISALSVSGSIPERLNCKVCGNTINRIETDIDITYNLPKPLQLIITENHMKLYNELFHFLWKLKCTSNAIDKTYRKTFPFFVLASEVDELPVYLHKFRIKFRECAHFIESVEEYAYVHMQERYNKFKEAWTSATDLYALSTIHGAYVNEISKVLFVSNEEVGSIMTNVIGFIGNAVDKLNAFIDVVSMELENRKGCLKVSRERVLKFNQTVHEMERRVDLELSNYEMYYNHFINAIAGVDNKQIRFLLRRLNPQFCVVVEPSEIAVMDD